MAAAGRESVHHADSDAGWRLGRRNSSQVRVRVRASVRVGGGGRVKVRFRFRVS